MSRLEQCEQQNSLHAGEALTLTRAGFHRGDYRHISSSVSKQMRHDSQQLQDVGVLGALTIEDKKAPDLLSVIKPLSDCVVTFDRFVRGQNEGLKNSCAAFGVKMVDRANRPFFP